MTCLEVADVESLIGGALSIDVASMETLDTLRAFDQACGADSCEICGCTDGFACPGGCHWVVPGLCSVCSGDDGASRLGGRPDLILIGGGR